MGAPGTRAGSRGRPARPERGARVFKVDGKALRLRDTLVFRDTHGNEVCKIQQRLGRMRDTMEIEGPNGQRMAMVKKAMITPLARSLRRQGRRRARPRSAGQHPRPTSTGSATWPRSRRSGSGCATPTGSKSRRGRTTCSSWRPPSASTRCRATPARRGKGKTYGPMQLVVIAWGRRRCRWISSISCAGCG